MRCPSPLYRLVFSVVQLIAAAVGFLLHLDQLAGRIIDVAHILGLGILHGIHVYLICFLPRLVAEIVVDIFFQRLTHGCLPVWTLFVNP